MTESTSTALSYADERRRWYQRRRGAWAVVLAAIVGVLAWVVYNGREYFEGAERLWRNREQNQSIAEMMAHEAPADQLVWDGFSADATKRRQVQTDPIARRWNDYGTATLFCHGRETESGQPILLVVEWSEGRDGHGPHLAATYTVPGALRRWPAAYGPYEVPIDWPLAGETPKRFFAGQPDPNDPTHFTIRVESDRGNGTIDARLRDDPSPAYPPFKIVATWRPDPTTRRAATRPAR